MAQTTCFLEFHCITVPMGNGDPGSGTYPEKFNARARRTLVHRSGTHVACFFPEFLMQHTYVVHMSIDQHQSTATNYMPIAMGFGRFGQTAI